MAYEIEIESLAYGGDGVGRRAGRAVFVPASAPGDRLSVEPLPGRARPERARILKVLRPGPGRQDAVCPHFGDCGGCQWQHVGAEVQLEAKRRALADALLRIGRIPAAELPEVTALAAPAPFGYRRRARLAVAEDGTLGFMARGDRRLVRIQSCRLLEPALERLVFDLSAALRRRPVPGLAHVELCLAQGRGAAELELRASLTGSGPAASLAAARPAAQALLEACPGLSGVVLSAGQARLEFGDPVIPDGPLLLRPDVFAQASREGNRALVELALARLEPRPTDRALELHAGSGNFSFALAPRVAALHAVELEGEALRLARRALPEALAPRVVFEGASAEAAVRALAAGGRRFEIALLDPPRTGAREALAAMAELVVRRIVYVSCDPATLARDVAPLRSQGFRITSATALDLFPQTYHLEAVVSLDRLA